MKITVGIIGMGSFGVFLAELLTHHAQINVIAFDSRKLQAPTNVTVADTLDQVVEQSDILVLGVPLGSYNNVLPHIKESLRPQTLIVDICSVKIKSEALIREYLPEHKNLLLTHPLFGPQSVDIANPAGHSLIVTGSEGDLADQVLDFCRNVLKLEVVNMSSDEHDQTMAQVHALTFFVAHGLGTMDLPEPRFMTPSYKKVLSLIELDKHHSPELYDTIQNGNPYARKMRESLLQTLQSI